jgi:hypothetical protein
MITPSWRICLDRWIALDAVCTTLRLGELAEPTPDRDVIRVHEASGRRMKRAILNAHTRIKSATGLGRMSAIAQRGDAGASAFEMISVQAGLAEPVAVGSVQDYIAF